MKARLHCLPIVCAFAMASPSIVKEDATYPPPVVVYLLSESDEDLLDTQLVDAISPILRVSLQHAIAISLWQEPGGSVVCYQIVWEDGTLHSGSTRHQGVDTSCKLLEGNVFTLDSDEIAGVEWMDSTLLTGSRVKYSHGKGLGDTRIPIIVVSEGSTEAILAGRLVDEFLEPLRMAYEAPITMISIRMLEDQNILYVTIFGGAGVPRSSVRVPHASPTSLTFQDYLRALEQQQKEHVS